MAEITFFCPICKGNALMTKAEATTHLKDAHDIVFPVECKITLIKILPTRTHVTFIHMLDFDTTILIRHTKEERK